MKKIRNVVMKYHICAIAAIAFMLFSCGKEKAIAGTIDKSVEPLASTANAAYTDRDVFKAIMFLDGTASTLLSDYKDINLKAVIPDQAKVNQVIAFENSVIDEIQKTDANFLANFRTQVKSGDFNKVQTAVFDGATKVFDTSVKLSGQTQVKADSIANDYISYLKTTYQVSEKSTLADFKNVASAEKTKNLRGYPSVYYYKYTYLWLYAAAAAAIIILLLLGRAQHLTSNAFVTKSYLSEITVKFKNI